MTNVREFSASLQSAGTQHPLEPLTVEEVATAVAVVRAQNVGEQFRFPCVVLHEPPKSVVLNFQTGAPTNREAFLILLDNTTGRTYEAIVSLTEGKVTSWKHIPDVQPNIMPDELGECEAAVKANPEFQAVLAHRGITDLELVMVDPWAIGNLALVF